MRVFDNCEMTNCAQFKGYNLFMETIYIDRLFILNLIIDYFILLCSAKVCGLKFRRLRYALGALLGALFAACSILPGMSFLSLSPIKLIIGILMALIAFGKEEKLLRSTAVFFAVSALFGGAVWAISLKSGTNPTGAVYVPLSMPVLVISFSLIYSLLSLVFNGSAKRAEKQIVDAEIRHMGSSVSLRALRDTGNTLIDPVTGDSVMITSASALCKLSQEFKNLSADNIAEFPDFKFRLIPYRAVGTSGGLLPAFRPEKITVDGHCRDDVLVAVSNDISGDGFNAII